MIRKTPYLCEMCKKHFDEPNIVKEKHCEYNVCPRCIVNGLHSRVIVQNSNPSKIQFDTIIRENKMKENKILYTELIVKQATLLQNKIYETLLDYITNGEILFEDYQVTEEYEVKGVRWDIKLTVIE